MSILTEYDLFDGYADDPGRPVIVCGTGSNFEAGCGSVVANTFKGRKDHVAFHDKLVWAISQAQ